MGRQRNKSNVIYRMDRYIQNNSNGSYIDRPSDYESCGFRPGYHPSTRDILGDSRLYRFVVKWSLGCSESYLGTERFR